VTILGHEDQVLEAQAAVAAAVEARLDGDHVAGNEVLTRAAHVRQLVDLEADTVAEAVEEAVLEDFAGLLVQLRLVAGAVEDVADLLVQLASVHARLDFRSRGVERFLDEPVPLLQLL
jgi:hypothetical protein